MSCGQTPVLRVLLLRKIQGKLLVILVTGDGSPIQRGPPVKDFLRAGAAKRLHLEQLPGYAPDVNPDEGSWNDLKRVELGNCCSPVSRPARARCGVASRHGAPAPQAHGHPGLHQPGGLSC
jgi:hypothetical protein